MIEAKNHVDDDIRPCSFFVEIKPPSAWTKASYLDIWAAAVAVTEMCIQFGKIGHANMLGE